MRSKLTWTFFIGVAVAAAGGFAERALATPQSGFSGTTIAKARFADIDVFVHSFPPNLSTPWLSMQKTHGPSDLYVQSNVWAVGGSTGWHTHPGHSLILVTAGTVTGYEGDDPTCSPHLYSVGTGFVDPGGNHVHLLRNEGAVEARTIAVQLIPADATRRIDADANPACGF